MKADDKTQIPLSELFARLDTSLTYPITGDAVLERIGSLRITAPNVADDQTIEAVLRPLRVDTYASTEELFFAIYGSLNEGFIGRKFYDDRGDNPIEVRQLRDDEPNTSF